MSILDFYQDRRVLVTGHTGFKGSWLVLWLKQLGAHVTGWSIDIPTNPSLFEVASIADICDHNFGDINDLDALSKLIKRGEFDVVFHFAAQPLVRHSYREPLSTLTTNVIGTANLLEAIRAAGHPCHVVAITSDKCYENEGSLWGFREVDPLGGSDPYSMSKAAAELVISSWRSSFFSDPKPSIKIASARAGNVIGGGDWAQDRIVTDCIAALSSNQAIEIRNPEATRPWQHVLEPLSGYLTLGARLGDGKIIESAWNFGPATQSVRKVRELAEILIDYWGEGSWLDVGSPADHKEARKLSLNCDKAYQILNWEPIWDFRRTVSETASWFSSFVAGEDMLEFTLAQLNKYVSDAQSLGAGWVRDSTS